MLQSNSLIINRKKCMLGRQEVEYLGHIVSGQGVRIDPAKISAVIKWPTPNSIRGLRGFSGLTGYYHRFIYDYGKIAAPLTTLLKKENSHWYWSKEAEGAFQELKRALTSAPLLGMPDFSKEFVIECDASGRGIGTVLMQEGKPIAYFSKHLSSRLLSKSASSLNLWHRVQFVNAINMRQSHQLGCSAPCQFRRQFGLILVSIFCVRIIVLWWS